MTIKRQTINGHTIEKYYNDGKLIAYVDDKLTDKPIMPTVDFPFVLCQLYVGKTRKDNT